MSIKIFRFARQIADKLDASDNDGSNNKIGKETWNVFAEGKGNKIRNYICMQPATQSIASYLTKQTDGSDADVHDLGQKWLNSISNSSVPEYDSENFENNFEYTYEDEEDDEDDFVPVDLEDTVEPASIDEESPTIDNKSIITNNNTYEPQDNDDEILEYDKQSLNDENNDISEKVSDIVNASIKKWKYSNISADLSQKVANEIAKLNVHDISMATVIKTIKQNLYKELFHAFNRSVNATSKFIYNIAQDVNNGLEIQNLDITRNNIVNIAQAYLESNITSQTEGNVYFSNNKRRAWCADTVSTILLDTFGDKAPRDFRHLSSVSSLRTWGINNGSYTNTSIMKQQARKEYIAHNVKPGDIMIEKRNKSHTGIVIEVAEDGSWFKTVEGNASKQVKTNTYHYNSKTLSGFISMEKFVDKTI